MLKLTLQRVAVDEWWKLLCLMAMAIAIGLFAKALASDHVGPEMLITSAASLATLMLIGQMYFGNVETNAVLDEHKIRVADGGLLCLIAMLLIATAACAGLGMRQAHVLTLLAVQALNVVWLGWTGAVCMNQLRRAVAGEADSSERRDERASLEAAATHLKFWFVNNVVWLSIALSTCALVSLVIPADPSLCFEIQYVAIVVLLTVNRIADVHWNRKVYERAAFRSLGG